MKKHLVLIAALFAIVLMAPSLFAQDTTAPAATAPAATSKPKGPDAQLADLTAKLKLTDDQQSKIGVILTDQAKKLKKSKKSAATPEDAKADAKNIRQDANSQIRALLTPDQQTIFDADAKSAKHHKKSASE
jgi:Spy/CpxP family protein refolding chaperone